MDSRHIATRLKGPYCWPIAMMLMAPLLAPASAQTLYVDGSWNMGAGSKSTMGDVGCGSPAGSAACVPGQIYTQAGAIKGLTTACVPTADPSKAAYSVAAASNYGVLSGFTKASASLATQLPDSGCKAEVGGGTAVVSAFSDSLTIVSDTLPEGAPVQLKLTMTLASKLASKAIPASLYCDGRLSAQGLLGLGRYGGSYTLTHTECSGTSAQKVVAMLTSAVGAQQSFGGQLTLSAAVDVYVDRLEFPWGPASDTAVGSLGSPTVAKYAVQVLTPGASYVALSGTTYPTK